MQIQDPEAATPPVKLAAAHSEPAREPKIRFARRDGVAFYRDVKSRVTADLEKRGKTRFADRRVWLKAGFFLATGVASYVAILAEAAPPAGLLALAIVFGLSCLFLGLSIAHDAAHDALTPNKKLNYFLHFITFSLLGVDARLWRLRHVRSHHVFPNVNGCDADIDHNGFLRLTPNHPRRWFHGFQHLYAPLLYGIVNLHSIFIQDAIYITKKRLANITDMRHNLGDVAQFLATKFYYFFIALALPILVMDLHWSWIVLGYLIMTATISIVFISLLIGTHFAEEAAFPEIAPDGTIDSHWAIHAIDTSVDWSPTSRWANFFCGGINTHVAHHLFPNVCHIHYPDIAPIIQETAAEHGLRLNETTLGGLVRSHFRFLRKLGRRDDDAPRPQDGAAAPMDRAA